MKIVAIRGKNLASLEGEFMIDFNIAITNVVIVGMKIFFQEICFTNIHRIYQLSFFVEQAEFVV